MTTSGANGDDQTAAGKRHVACFVRLGDGVVGPANKRELLQIVQNGVMDRETEVWVGDGNWVKASQIKGIQKQLSANPELQETHS